MEKDYNDETMAKIETFNDAIAAQVEWQKGKDYIADLMDCAEERDDSEILKDARQIMESDPDFSPYLEIDDSDLLAVIRKRADKKGIQLDHALGGWDARIAIACIGLGELEMQFDYYSDSAPFSPEFAKTYAGDFDAAINRHDMGAKDFLCYSAANEYETAWRGVDSVELFYGLQEWAQSLICEICPYEGRAEFCLANGDSVIGSIHESDVMNCCTSGDCEDACRYIAEYIGVTFRIVARNDSGEYENRIATNAEKEATCRAIYFESDSDFADVEMAEIYLIWQAANSVETEQSE